MRLSIFGISENRQKFIEPAVLVAFSLLAGSTRLVKYFPGASTKGLLVSAGLTGLPILLSDRNSRPVLIIAGLAIGVIFTLSVAKKLRGALILM